MKIPNLDVFDMTECSRLKNIPKELAKLKSLRHVIYDENVGQQWLAIKAFSMPNLIVQSVPRFVPNIELEKQ